MAKKTVVTWHIAPLQVAIVEDITDPAEMAAIDEMRQRLKRKKSGPKAKGNGKGTKAASKPPAKRRG